MTRSHDLISAQAGTTGTFPVYYAMSPSIIILAAYFAEDSFNIIVAKGPKVQPSLMCRKRSGGSL